MTRQTCGLFVVLFTISVIGCGRQSKMGPPQADEVVLKVPGMT